MPPEIPAAATVAGAMGMSWTAGTILFAAFTRIGGRVQAGHFKVMWMVCAGLAALTGFWHAAAWALAAMCVAAFIAVYLKIDVYAGSAAAAAGLVVLAIAPLPLPYAMVSGFAGALLLGAASNAMLLGHWHLNQPRLRTGPLMRLVWSMWAGIAAFVGSSVYTLLRGLADEVGTTVTGASTAVAFTVFVAVLAAMVTHLVRTRSIMSATGILYLQILLCAVAVFTGHLAALALS